MIGGLATVVHGAEVNTVDLDVIVEQSRANLERVADALREIGARRITEANVHYPDGEPAPATSYELTERVESFATPAGKLDILREARVIGGYHDIGPRAQAYLIEGNQVYVADLDTVIKAKEATERPKDRVHLEALYDLRAALSGDTDPVPRHEPEPEIDPAALPDRMAAIDAQIDQVRRTLADLETRRQQAEQERGVIGPEHGHGHDR